MSADAPLLAYAPAANDNIVCDLRPDGATIRILANRRKILVHAVFLVIEAACLVGICLRLRQTIPLGPSWENMLVIAAMALAGVMWYHGNRIMAFSGVAVIEIDAKRLVATYNRKLQVLRHEFNRSDIANVFIGRLSRQQSVLCPPYLGLQFHNGFQANLGIGDRREVEAIAAALSRAMGFDAPIQQSGRPVRSPDRCAERAPGGTKVSIRPRRSARVMLLIAALASIAALIIFFWMRSNPGYDDWRRAAFPGATFVLAFGLLFTMTKGFRRHVVLFPQNGHLILLEGGWPRSGSSEWPLDAISSFIISDVAGKSELGLRLTDGRTATLVSGVSSADAAWIASQFQGSVRTELLHADNEGSANIGAR